MGSKAGVQGHANQRSDAPGAGPSHGNSESERTCVLTRVSGSKDKLIRLALGPDGQVAPDVRARAPGRGAYVGVRRAALETAQAKMRILRVPALLGLGLVVALAGAGAWLA